MSAAEKLAVKPAEQYCGFRIGDGVYGIPVLNVQEVIKPQVVTPIPLAQEFVRGLINLRGQIVTSIGLRRLFGLEDNLSADHMNIIVKSDDGLISLVVDEILDVVDVDQDKCEPTPDTIDHRLKKYVDGVFKMENQLFILLNINEILKF